MSAALRPVWPFVMMLIWYRCLMVLSAGLSLLGHAFGSDAFRGAAMPMAEWAIVAGQLLASIGFLIAAIYCWQSGKRGFACGLWAASRMGVPGIGAVSGVLVR